MLRAKTRSSAIAARRVLGRETRRFSLRPFYPPTKPSSPKGVFTTLTSSSTATRRSTSRGSCRPRATSRRRKSGTPTLTAAKDPTTRRTWQSDGGRCERAAGGARERQGCMVRVPQMRASFTSGPHRARCDVCEDITYLHLAMGFATGADELPSELPSGFSNICNTSWRLLSATVICARRVRKQIAWKHLAGVFVVPPR